MPHACQRTDKYLSSGTDTFFLLFFKSHLSNCPPCVSVWFQFSHIDYFENLITFTSLPASSSIGRESNTFPIIQHNNWPANRLCWKWNLDKVHGKEKCNYSILFFWNVECFQSNFRSLYTGANRSSSTWMLVLCSHKISLLQSSPKTKIQKSLSY